MPVEFFFGGDDLLPKVEEALAGQAAGFEAHLHLEPEHAFGDYDTELVCFEDRALFPESVETGMQFEGLPDGSATPDMPADVDLHRDRGLPVARGAGRQPPAGRHGAAAAPDGARRARGDSGRDRGRQRRRWRRSTVLEALPAARGLH